MAEDCVVKGAVAFSLHTLDLRAFIWDPNVRDAENKSVYNSVLHISTLKVYLIVFINLFYISILYMQYYN